MTGRTLRSSGKRSNHPSESQRVTTKAQHRASIEILVVSGRDDYGRLEHAVATAPLTSERAVHIAVVGPTGRVPSEFMRPIDIMLVYLHTDDLSSLTWALGEHSNLGAPETVFVAAGARHPSLEPLARILRQPIIHESRLLGWLTASATHLADVAQARRMVLEAESRIPQTPDICDSETRLGEGLFGEEKCFREAYVRAALN